MSPCSHHLFQCIWFVLSFGILFSVHYKEIQSVIDYELFTDTVKPFHIFVFRKLIYFRVSQDKKVLSHFEFRRISAIESNHYQVRHTSRPLNVCSNGAGNIQSLLPFSGTPPTKCITLLWFDDLVLNLSRIFFRVILVYCNDTSSLQQRPTYYQAPNPVNFNPQSF